MFTTTETTARPTRSMPDFRVPPRELVDVGHSRLAYRRVGRGPDLLLVHGWPLTMATYRRLLPTLAEQFTCHLVDLPGAGFTEISERTPISMHDHCDTLERAIEVIGLDRYALLAHDSGGFFARAVAARHGDRVTGIVLGNTETPGSKLPLRIDPMRVVETT